MAPEVVVPADFGRRHLNCPSHGNLTFTTLQPPRIRANSIILSLNSPVIDHLTTELLLTSLDAGDFSREAVDCFIEACYTGEIEAVTLQNFRDVNKMGHVFQVSWLSARCEGYFAEYVEGLSDESGYQEVMFAVQEAVYALTVPKKRNFLEIIGSKTLLSAERLNVLMMEYLFSDFSSCSSAMIDVCIAMVRSNVDVLLNGLTSHLTKNPEVHLDSNSRYLLRNVDLSVCLTNHPATHGKLFAVLENLTEVAREDFQLFVSLSKSGSSQGSSKELEVKPISQTLKQVQIRSIKPVLEAKDLDVLYDQLTADESIGNLYVFFEAVMTWLVMNSGVSISATFLEKIIHVREEYEWSKISSDYLEKFIVDQGVNGLLINEVTLCSDLVDMESTGVRFPVVLLELPCEDFVQEIFRRDNIFKFTLPGVKYSGMEFMLLSSAEKDNEPFTLKWGLYQATKNLISLPRLHFTLRRCAAHDDTWQVIPITWCGAPTCDKTGNLWNWGYVKFHTKKMRDLKGSMMVGKEEVVAWNHYLSVAGRRVQLVCFVED